MIQNLIARFRAWRARRHWAATHIEWLRTLVHGDVRWLANDPVARAITERYEAALSEDWYTRVHEDVSDLRTRLGLDPHGRTAPAATEAPGLTVELDFEGIGRAGPFAVHEGHVTVPHITVLDLARWLKPTIEALAAVGAIPEPLQPRVQPWLMECFGPMIAGDREERNHRFLEEALELVQACGCNASEAHQLVEYVFSRPVGEKGQEAGGTMITLAALCLANDLDMHAEGERELARITQPEMVMKIRAKQAAKPKYSPLPIAPAAAAAPGPVTQAWTHGIPMMQQSVLLSAIRGPDGLAKYGGGAKMLLRWLRRCVLLSAMDGKVLADPIEANGGSFTGPSLDGPDEQDHWSDRMQEHVNDYLRQVDALPHHFQMHFLHAAEIIGYKHPDAQIRLFWNRLYLRLVNDFHLWPETEEQMDSRLGDSRRGWLERADPATIA